jgi:hypothetical protein
LRFSNAPGKIARSWFEGDGFGDDAADFGKVSELTELFTVRNGA